MQRLLLTLSADMTQARQVKQLVEGCTIVEIKGFDAPKYGLDDASVLLNELSHLDIAPLIYDSLQNWDDSSPFVEVELLVPTSEEKRIKDFLVVLDEKSVLWSSEWLEIPQAAAAAE